MTGSIKTFCFQPWMTIMQLLYGKRSLPPHIYIITSLFWKAMTHMCGFWKKIVGLCLKIFMRLVLCWVFKSFSGITFECQTVLIQTRPNRMLDLILIKTFCKGNQQDTMVDKIKIILSLSSLGLTYFINAGSSLRVLCTSIFIEWTFFSLDLLIRNELREFIGLSPSPGNSKLKRKLKWNI